jgi:glycosyltransferase involved in cell wall biosynthesis
METNKKLISIVVPSFNREAFIRGCLESIYNQTYKNFECIVIDGGSSDDTLSILSEYAEKNENFRFISEKDEGMYYAINKGLSMTKGDIIAYLNTDDRYFEWSLELIANELNYNDVVFGELCIIKDDTWYPQFYKDFNLTYYSKFHTIAQPTVFFTRKVYDIVGGFDTSFKLLADCDYWLRIYSNGFKLKHLNEFLAIQIDHDDTLREKHAEIMYNEFKRIHEYGGGFSKIDALIKPISTKFFSRIRKSKFLLGFMMKSKQNDNWVKFYHFLKEPKIQLKDLVSIWLPGKFQQKRFINNSPLKIDLNS